MSKRRGPGEGSVGQRPDGIWEARFQMGHVGGTRVRPSFYGQTRREAARKRDEARRAWEASGAGVAERQTVAIYCRRWLTTIAPSLRPRTADSYGVIVEQSIIPALGARRLDRLTRGDVQGWVVELTAAGKAPATVKNHHAILRKALNDAHRDGLVPRNVSHRVVLPRSTHPEIRPWTAEQTGAFLAHAVGDRLEALYWIAATLGLRQGELLGLRWADVDLDGHALMVRRQLQRRHRTFVLVEPKTDAGRRVVPVNADLADRLRHHRTHQRKEQLVAGIAWTGNPWGLVFTAADGSPIVARTLTDRFHRMADDAGLPRVRFHDLRHGAATFMVAERWPIEVVSRTLGHSSSAITSALYVHATRNQIRGAIEGVADLLKREANRGGVTGGVRRVEERR